VTRVVRAALTQTVNAYGGMPASVDQLAGLGDRLDDIRKANVDHHLELMRLAAADKVQVICFGELFTAPYFALGREPVWLGLAEDAGHGPTVTALRAAARDLGMIVVAPIYELAGEQRFNTAVVIDEHGAVLGCYRKTHIPHGHNEQGEFAEDFYYQRSDGDMACGPANVAGNRFFPVFTTSVGRIGVAICYDRHFEGVMSTLAAGGAELVFSPAVTFGAKSQRMWPLEFAVDAERHHLFIGGSNRKGSEPPWGQAYFGDSHFVGPGGRLDDRSEHPELIIADCDLDELRAADPAGWDLGRDARPDIYGPRR